MPAVVRLDIVPPETDDYTQLLVYESATQAGAPGALISTVAITSAAYPTYVVVNATAENYWFSIKYVNAQGAPGPYSDPVQGGTYTLLATLVTRVMQRDLTIDENIVVQEAEAIIEEFFPTLKVWAVTPGQATLRQISGMTLLLLARIYLMNFLTEASTDDSFTAGLVSLKSTSATKRDLASIKEIIALANSYLGLHYSVKLLLKEIEVGGGYKQLQGVDMTRLIYEVG